MPVRAGLAGDDSTRIDGDPKAPSAFAKGGAARRQIFSSMSTGILGDRVMTW